MSKKGRRQCTLLTFLRSNEDAMCSLQGVQSISGFPSHGIPPSNPLKNNSHDSLSGKMGSSSRFGCSSADTHSYTIFSSAFLGKSPCHSDPCQHQWKAERKWQIGCNYQFCQTSVPIELVRKCCFPRTSLADTAVGSQRGLEWVFGDP